MTNYYTSESELIEYIQYIFNTSTIGDDCATLYLPSPIVMSSDICMEDVDFTLSKFTAEDIGYKSLAINISDIFAMGAIPLGFSMCLTLPPTLSKKYINSMLSSMSILAKKYSLMLSGGDICKGDKLSISITIWGFAQTPIRRATASVGDCIFYISPEDTILGLARTGYLSLDEGDSSYSKSIAFQKKPPLLENNTIALLQEYAHEISLMDISDGLSQDIPRLLGKELGAEVFLTENMLDPEIISWSMKHDICAYEHAFLGGEEYCLLATANKEIFTDIKKKIPSILLGYVTESRIISCNNKVFSNTGFDHFTS